MKIIESVKNMNDSLTLQFLKSFNDFIEETRVNPGCTGTQLLLEDELRIITDDKDKIIGFVHFTIDSNCNFINFLYVIPKFRKQGYGKKLVELSSHQKSTKLNCLYREEKARSFYENLGFEPEFIVYRKIS
jgi:GNAT superfamily N-acetyltransferase